LFSLFLCFLSLLFLFDVEFSYNLLTILWQVREFNKAVLQRTMLISIELNSSILLLFFTFLCQLLHDFLFNFSHLFFVKLLCWFCTMSSLSITKSLCFNNCLWRVVADSLSELIEVVRVLSELSGVHFEIVEES
jgi:hypothetical protein